MTPQVGARAIVGHVVGQGDTAQALGSGDLQVLGTPRLLAWFEQATVQAVEDQLDSGSTTVGTRVEVVHERASALGSGVTIRAGLGHVDGRLLRFDVSAEDSDGIVLAHGQLTRVVVDRARFLSRL